MLDAARQVVQFTRGITFATYLGDPRSHLWLGEKVEEAVEAARKLPGGGGKLPELARFVRARRP
ncbi:MAG TPA: hypothetical protein VGB47_04405 [Thermoanaerobaculia bacterium]|jgi:hypothetical protein